MWQLSYFKCQYETKRKLNKTNNQSQKIHWDFSSSTRFPTSKVNKQNHKTTFGSTRDIVWHLQDYVTIILSKAMELSSHIVDRHPSLNDALARRFKIIINLFQVASRQLVARIANDAHLHTCTILILVFCVHIQLYLLCRISLAYWIF